MHELHAGRDEWLAGRRTVLGCTASYPPAAAVSLLTPVLGHLSFHQAGPGAAGPAQPGSAAAGGPRQPTKGRAGAWRRGAPPRQPLCAAAGGLRVHGHQGESRGAASFGAHAYIFTCCRCWPASPSAAKLRFPACCLLHLQTLDELQRDAFPAVAASRPARALGTAVQVRAAAPCA